MLPLDELAEKATGFILPAPPKDEPSSELRNTQLDEVYRRYLARLKELGLPTTHPEDDSGQ